MARHALLIGVSEFTDQRLARLNAPTNDVIALRGILDDSSRGSFDSVELSVNEDFLAVRDHLSSFFHDRAPDDVLLLYYSGHGILGRGNRLFLATSGSNLDTPRTRSVAAQEIRDFIEDSRAQRQIVVLDCCHSGAFAEHAKTAGPPPAVTSNTFSSGDAGLYVLTAADTLQFAWDGAELRAGNEAAAGFSQFTSWLVEGLEKGEAAPEDEQITMDALYRYLSRRARSEGRAATPQRFVQGGVGDLVISANPLVGSAQLDPDTIAALMEENWRTRLGAVTELAQQMHEGGTFAARAARLALQRHLDNRKYPELNYRVRDAIANALALEEKQQGAAQTEGEEQERAEAARLAEEEKQRAEVAQQAEEEKQRAEVARQAEEEKQRAEAARLAEEEKQRAETARLAEEEKQREAARLAAEEKRRAEAARQAEEEKRRTEAARQAEEEKQRAEAARLAEEEKQRAEATRQAEEEKQRAEAARQAEEEKRRAEAARQAKEENERAEVARQAEEEQRAEVAWLAVAEKQRAGAERLAAAEKQRAEAERAAKQRAEAARQAEEEKRRAEAARLAEDEKQRAEVARLAEDEKQRAEVARLAEEEKRRAEAARQAEEEKRRAEAARQAEEEQRRTEAARLAVEEQRRAEAARLAEEEKRRAGAARNIGGSAPAAPLGSDFGLSWVIIAELSQCFSGKTGAYIQPHIPPRKERNARAAAGVPADDFVWILFDFTLFGSAKNCLVAGRRGLYYHNWIGGNKRQLAITYEDFKDAVITDLNALPKLGVRIGEVEMSLAGSGDWDVSRDFLRSLQQRLRAAPR